MSINEKIDSSDQGSFAAAASDRGSAPIEMSPDEFRTVGYKLVDSIAKFLGQIEELPVTTGRTPEEIKQAVRSVRSLPERGESPELLVERTAELLLANSLFNGHPRFWGYITSSPAPIGMLGDFLASAVNSNVGSWQLAPAATEIEGQTVRWIADLLGYPSDCGGVLVSGGNMANFVCFLTARTAAGGADIRTKGLAGRSLRVYASRETHTWIEKATDLFGLGTDSICWVETDSEQRLDLSDLKHKVARDRIAGHTPAVVVGTAGTVSTGAVDPLKELARFCRENRIWFHVDGAYGAFAILANGVDAAIEGLREADSIAVDPHKWLYAPLEAGCALVRNRELMRETFSFHPPYYRFEEDMTNYVDYGLQNSRGFRALKVWLALQQAGRNGYAAMIEDDMRMAREMYRGIENEPALEPFSCKLSIVTFRYLPPDLRVRVDEPAVAEYLNKLNEELLVRLKRGGEIFISNAVSHGRFLLRACIVNFRTRLCDVEAAPRIVVRVGALTDAELRAEFERSIGSGK